MRYLMQIVLLLFSSFGIAQSLTVTPGGLRDSQDTTKSFIIFEVPDVPKEELYKRALKYANEFYKHGRDAIRGDNEGEYLRIGTFAEDFMKYNNTMILFPVVAEYNVEMRFKDGRVRYEIKDLRMRHANEEYKHNYVFRGSIVTAFPIYKTNGKLFKPREKEQIEKHFNYYITHLHSFLRQTATQEEW